MIGEEGCFLLDLEKEGYCFEKLPIEYKNIGHSANLFEGSVYLFGGYMIYDNALRAINVNAKNFSMKKIDDVNGFPPSARWGHGSEILRDSILIFGG